MPDRDFLLRELNHRVKNNFQIIVSLMNLKMRMLPPEQREHIRFLQEHVQSMAVAFRLVYANGEMTSVAIGHLLTEVVSELRQIARLGVDQVRLSGADITDTMGLDQSIAFGLCLAVILPPYLDRARQSGGHAAIRASVADRVVTLSLSGGWRLPVARDTLRDRLTAAYMRQLKGELLPPSDPSEVQFRLPLELLQQNALMPALRDGA